MNNQMNEYADQMMYSAFLLACAVLSISELRVLCALNDVGGEHATREELIHAISVKKFGVKLVLRNSADETISTRILPIVHLIDVMQPCQPVQSLCGKYMQPLYPGGKIAVTLTNSPMHVTCPECERLIAQDIADRT